MLGICRKHSGSAGTAGWWKSSAVQNGRIVAAFSGTASETAGNRGSEQKKCTGRHGVFRLSAAAFDAEIGKSGNVWSDGSGGIQYADKREEQKDVSEKSIKGLHILLAEDNELNMEIAEFMLQNEGAVVTKTWNGQEAVEIFEKSRPDEFDVILMDIMMPVKNGYEAAKMIRSMDREDAKTIPIIAMTANAFTEDRIKAMEADMIFDVLMGEKVEPRREFIQENAKYVTDLDI